MPHMVYEQADDGSYVGSGVEDPGVIVHADTLQDLCVKFAEGIISIKEAYKLFENAKLPRKRAVVEVDMKSGKPSKVDTMDLIFSMQKELAKMMPKDRYPDNTGDRISALCTAMMHEVVELQRLTNWKWWKHESPLNIDDATEELIDVWHFVIQASLVLGLTPEMVLDAYMKKHAINVKRQEDGY